MIALSQDEVKLLLTALRHTQEYTREDAIADEDNRAEGTDQWCKRKFASEALTAKLENAQ